MRRRILLPLALLMLGVSAKNQTHRQPAPATPQPHAEWSEWIETYFGLTQEIFKNAGLSKLTKDEYSVLLTAMNSQKAKAGEDAKKQQVTYVCGRIPASYDRVKIVIKSDEGAPAEIMSPLRQKLRAMPDVDIVFEPQQADFGIMIVPMATRNEANYPIGYAVSVVTYTPCQAQLRDTKWPMNLINNHWIFTAGTAPTVVDRIVSSIDTDDIEATRRLHASIKAILSK